MIHESFTETILRMFIEKYVSSKIIEKINVWNIDVCTFLENIAFGNYVELYTEVIKEGCVSGCT